MLTYRTSYDRSLLSFLSVWIVPKVWSTDDAGRVLLSAACVTEGELDYEIDAMIASLERVRHQAKQAMRRYRRRQQQARKAS